MDLKQKRPQNEVIFHSFAHYESPPVPLFSDGWNWNSFINVLSHTRDSEAMKFEDSELLGFVFLSLIMFGF